MLSTRPIDESDIGALGQLLDDTFRHPQGIADQRMLDDFPLVFIKSNRPNCRVIEDGCRIVSHAALWPRTLESAGGPLKVGVIVAVVTHPKFRHRGLAAFIMRDLQATMRKQKYDLGVLWTGVPDFYRKLGWEIVVPRGKIVHLAADTGASLAPEADFEIQSFDERCHLDQIVALYNLEPFRFHRSRDEFKVLATLNKVGAWVAIQQSQVVAYLVNANGYNKRGIIEYGGKVTGIVALVQHVLKDQPPGTEWPLLLYHSHEDLQEWVTSRGLPSRPLESSKGKGCEMILVLCPERVTRRVRDDLFVWGLDQA